MFPDDCLDTDVSVAVISESGLKENMTEIKKKNNNKTKPTSLVFIWTFSSMEKKKKKEKKQQHNFCYLSYTAFRP